MSSRTLLLSRLEFRPSTAARDAALVFAASWVLALGAQVRMGLPGTPVPITGQTFVVGLAGMLLGGWRGAAAVLLYMAYGAAGLPVFSGGSGGAAVLAGPTAGYLLAMPFAAALAGWLAARGWDNSFPRAFVNMLASSLVVMAAGTAWLWPVLGGLDRAVAAGFLPFLPGDVVKAALAGVLLPSLWSLRRRGA